MQQFRVMILFCRIRINNFNIISRWQRIQIFSWLSVSFPWTLLHLNASIHRNVEHTNCKNWNVSKKDCFRSKSSLLYDLLSSFRWNNSKQKFKTLSNFDVQSSIKLKKQKIFETIADLATKKIVQRFQRRSNLLHFRARKYLYPFTDELRFPLAKLPTKFQFTRTQLVDFDFGCTLKINITFPGNRSAHAWNNV